MKKIELTQSKVTLIDDCDFELISHLNWYARKDRHTFYAQRKFKIDGKWRNIMLHRFIMKPPKNMFIDHINRNGLDNRRKNLRIVTHSQNHFNEKIRCDNTSGVKGVCWHKGSQKWYVHLAGKYIGTFKNFKDAEKCRKDAFKTLNI